MGQFKSLFEMDNQYFSKKKLPITTIKPIKYVNGVLQVKVKRIRAYKVTLPKMDTYYTDYGIFAEPLKNNLYNFYFEEIGRLIFNEPMTFEKFYERFKSLSKLSIDSHIDDYKKDNSNSGLYGNLNAIEPGIYPKKGNE